MTRNVFPQLAGRRFLLLVFVATSVLVVHAALVVHPAHAQYTPGTRTYVPSSQALGMGGAALAYPSTRTALFYNPAQLTRLHVTRTPITMFGLTASLSQNFSEQYDFYNNRLNPAFADGVENLSEEEAEALFDDARSHAGSPTVFGADVLLPSFVMNRGTFGFGGGVFVHSEMTYNVEDTGAEEAPNMDFAALADFMAIASGSADLGSLGLKGLSAGMTAKYAQRYVSLKLLPFDAIDAEESLYVLGASTVAFDLGLLYEINVLPGRLYLGAVWSDLALSDFDYRFSAYYVKNEEERDDAAVDAEIALATERYQLDAAMRLGASYVLPALGGPFTETVVAVDYVDYDTPFAQETSMLDHFSMGVQTTLSETLSLRTGLNQGHTSLGLGVELPFARLDYAFFQSDLGRLPGQPASRHHRIALSLGSF